MHKGGLFQEIQAQAIVQTMAVRFSALSKHVPWSSSFLEVFKAFVPNLFHKFASKVKLTIDFFHGGKFCMYIKWLRSGMVSSVSFVSIWFFIAPDCKSDFGMHVAPGVGTSKFQLQIFLVFGSARGMLSECCLLVSYYESRRLSFWCLDWSRHAKYIRVPLASKKLICEKLTGF